ncbi:MAG: coproporphyrinogen-III oxidase family protein, partial [Chlamydiales bacterium]
MNLLQKQINETFSDNEMPSYIYTYPVKKFYQPFTDWKKACESWSQVEGPTTIYIHIPFCEMKCSFCDLFTATNQPKDVIERYVKALITEIKMMKPYLRTDQLKIQSVYFGGGTPSLLNENQLGSIISELRTTFTIDANIEWSIEGAPNSFSEEKFTQLKALGINRISMGIQTFDERELRAMGRFYGATLGYTMAKTAISSGIKNINLDLIYGIPGQDFEKWRENLLTAIDLSPATITAYPLVVRDRTGYGKQMIKGAREDWIESRSKYQWYDFTNENLTRNGYMQHTLVTYAKQEGGCQHEAHEFLGASTLSFGAGARKYAPDFHYVDEDYLDRKPNKVTMMNYIESVEKGELVVRSAVKLTKTDQILRYLIL